MLFNFGLLRGLKEPFKSPRTLLTEQVQLQYGKEQPVETEGFDARIAGPRCCIE